MIQIQLMRMKAGAGQLPSFGNFSGVQILFGSWAKMDKNMTDFLLSQCILIVKMSSAITD